MFSLNIFLCWRMGKYRENDLYVYCYFCSTAPSYRPHKKNWNILKGIIFSQTDLLEKLKREEEEQLCIMAEPLRHYLVKYIFPTLTQGLVEVARLRPDDPIDFLVSTQLLLFLSPFRRWTRQRQSRSTVVKIGSKGWARSRSWPQRVAVTLLPSVGKAFSGDRRRKLAEFKVRKCNFSLVRALAPGRQLFFSGKNKAP